MWAGLPDDVWFPRSDQHISSVVCALPEVISSISAVVWLSMVFRQTSLSQLMSSFRVPELEIVKINGFLSGEKMLKVHMYAHVLAFCYLLVLGILILTLTVTVKHPLILTLTINPKLTPTLNLSLTLGTQY